MGDINSTETQRVTLINMKVIIFVMLAAMAVVDVRSEENKIQKMMADVQKLEAAIAAIKTGAVKKDAPVVEAPKAETPKVEDVKPEAKPEVQDAKPEPKPEAKPEPKPEPAKGEAAEEKKLENE